MSDFNSGKTLKVIEIFFDIVDTEHCNQLDRERYPKDEASLTLLEVI